MVGNGFGVDEVNKRLSESFFNNPEWPGGLWLEVPVACFVMLSLELPPPTGSWGGPRIWAEGFIRSRHRKMKFPIFLPTSMSLSWMFRWTFIAASNTARVRLWSTKTRRPIKILNNIQCSDKHLLTRNNYKTKIRTCEISFQIFNGVFEWTFGNRDFGCDWLIASNWFGYNGLWSELIYLNTNLMQELTFSTQHKS